MDSPAAKKSDSPVGSELDGTRIGLALLLLAVAFVVVIFALPTFYGPSNAASSFVLGDLIGRSSVLESARSPQGLVRFIVDDNTHLAPGTMITVADHSIAEYNGPHRVATVRKDEQGRPIVDTETPFAGSGKEGSFQRPDFQPPPRADLEKLEWVDMPVLDSLELLRERLANEQPLVSVEEALAMRNESPETNRKILSALGQQPREASEANYEAEILRHAAADANSINPVLASSTIEFDIGGMIGYGLFAFDWNFNRFAAKETVVSWQQTKDRMVDKVVMRSDAVWSDGTPITAHDIVFSWKAIMSSLVPVPAQRSGTDKLRWIEAYDDHTVVFFHKEPLATNHWNVQFSILPKHIYENSIAEDPTLVDSAYHVEQETKPISGGAYVVERRERGRELVLRARESYYLYGGKQVRERPYFDRIRFLIISDPGASLQALKAGQIEEKILTPEEWSTQTGDDSFYRSNTKAFGVEWVNFHFNWNLDSPFFSDVRVRRAMSLAFDHKELLEVLRFGMDEPCRGIFHPESPYYPDEPPPVDYNTRNLAEAERLLTEAGWIDTDNDGLRDKIIDGQKVKFDFTIIVSNRQDRIDICSLLKRNLAQVGVNVHVSPLDFTVVQQRLLERKFQASFGGWGTGATPDTSQNIWMSKEGRNFGNYSNPEVDRLFREAEKELDDEERNRKFQRIHQILYEDQPYTWLYYQNSYYAFNKRLRGYVFSPRGPYNYGPGFSAIWTPAAH